MQDAIISRQIFSKPDNIEKGAKPANANCSIRVLDDISAGVIREGASKNIFVRQLLSRGLMDERKSITSI